MMTIALCGEAGRGNPPSLKLRRVIQNPAYRLIDILKSPALCGIFFSFFFASPKKNQKRSPEIDYIPISGWFPDLDL